MCTIIYKELQCLLKSQKKVNVRVEFVCSKVSKTPDSSLIQQKKYSHLKCSALQILSFHKEICTSSLVSTVKSSLNRLLSKCF